MIRKVGGGVDTCCTCSAPWSWRLPARPAGSSSPRGCSTSTSHRPWTGKRWNFYGGDDDMESGRFCGWCASCGCKRLRWYSGGWLKWVSVKHFGFLPDFLRVPRCNQLPDDKWQCSLRAINSTINMQFATMSCIDLSADTDKKKPIFLWFFYLCRW